jgi:hypothetical protein
MTCRKFILAAACLNLMFGLSNLYGNVKLKHFTFKLESGKNGFNLEKDGRCLAKGILSIYNGRTKKFDKLKVVESNSGTQKDSLVLANHDYKVKLIFTPRSRLVLMTGEIINLTNKELWLQPELSLNIPRSDDDFFFNGLDTLPVTGKPMNRLGMKARPIAKIGSTASPFPIASAVGKQASFFVGQVCFEPVSYNGSKWKPLNSNRAEIIFLQRHAIGAGRSLKIRLVLGMTPTRYGKEEGVVQAMYDAFPELWQPVVGQDNPYVWGTHSQYRAWYFKPNYEKERRYYSRVEWGYAPYKRSGDIYGDPELWNYKPLVRDFKVAFASHIAGEIFNYKKLSLTEFHQKRKDIFQRYAKDFGYAFYPTCAGTWCEYTLAKKKYPDAITWDNKGVPMIYKNGWSTGHDKEIRVFPMGTSFAKALRADMKKIYKDLNPPGFALDGTSGGACYRGPAAKNPDMPGRAWDRQGVYIDQAVAVADFIRFIHEELKPGAAPADKPFVWGNGSSVRVDYAMIEATIFSPIFHSWMPNVRYNIGSTPCVMHGNGYLIQETIPDWRNMSRNKFIEELSKLTIYSVFNGFRYGMTSNHVTNNGNALEVYCIPELLEIIRLGWQAQVPADCYNGGKMLYKARYGRSEQTVFFFGNPYTAPMPVTFKIGNEFLGNAQYVFVRKMRDHAKTKNLLKDGETVFRETLKPRIPYLYEAVCGLSAIPAGGLNIEAESSKDINQIIFTLMLKNNPVFKTTIMPRKIRSFQLSSLLINGKAVKPGECEIPVNAKIVFKYKSCLFKVKAADILDFPFVDKQKRPVFSVQIPASPNAAELKQAERIQGYFRFCQKHKITSPGKVWLVKSDSSAKGPVIRIRVGRKGPEQYGITRNGKEILVNAGTAKEADELIRALFRVMDRRFEYLIPFGPVNTMKKEMLEKFGILGKTLPFTRCFESKNL